MAKVTVREYEASLDCWAIREQHRLALGFPAVYESEPANHCPFLAMGHYCSCADGKHISRVRP